jgi:hypothetical protein
MRINTNLYRKIIRSDEQKEKGSQFQSPSPKIGERFGVRAKTTVLNIDGVYYFVRGQGLVVHCILNVS